MLENDLKYLARRHSTNFTPELYASDIIAAYVAEARIWYVKKGLRAGESIDAFLKRKPQAHII